MAFRLNIGYTDIVLGTRAGFLYDSILIMPSFFCTLLKRSYSLIDKEGEVK